MTREYKIIIIFSFLFFFSNELEIFAKSINDEININNRTREISQNIRCLVCQNQSIDESNSELAKAFGATKTPHVYLFNQNEKLVFKGAIDDNAKDPNKVNHSYLMDAIEQMLNGEGIKKPISKAMGCSIKFN